MERLTFPHISRLELEKTWLILLAATADDDVWSDRALTGLGLFVDLTNSVNLTNLTNEANSIALMSMGFTSGLFRYF